MNESPGIERWQKGESAVPPRVLHDAFVRFDRAIRPVLDAAGAVPIPGSNLRGQLVNPLTSERFAIETRVGRLELSFGVFETSPTLCVHARFDDVERTVAVAGKPQQVGHAFHTYLAGQRLNRWSGKWNWHWPTADTRTDLRRRPCGIPDEHIRTACVQFARALADLVPGRAEALYAVVNTIAEETVRAARGEAVR